MPTWGWTTVKQTLANWRVWGVPGALVIGLVFAARLTGSLQGLELLALDLFLRSRPSEPPDDRIVLVGFEDIQATGYPIPEQTIVDVVQQLQTYQPAVIGLHIQKTQVIPSNATPNTPLFNAIHRNPNLIFTEVILFAADQLLAPANVPQKQIGFVDLAPDSNGALRRVSLGVNDPVDLEAYKFSLIIRLSEQYLVRRDPNLKLTNGIIDPYAMRFGATEIPRLLRDSGGYIDTDMGNPEMLLNVRMGLNPFRMVSAEAVQSGRVDPQWFRDRIVIVGITDPIIRPPIPTAADTTTNSLQIQAHAVSQIISAVLDKRLLFRTWSGAWDYGWIFLWGAIGVILSRRIHHPMRSLVIIGSINLGLISTSYLLLVLHGLWIPIVPVILALNLSIILPSAYESMYEQDKLLKSRLEERQRTIEQIFNTIHNGPLQTLATLLRRLRDMPLSTEQIIQTLEHLNGEMRSISDYAKQEALHQNKRLYLSDEVKLDLDLPFDELLYEVYTNTLDRPEFDQLGTVKVACDFEPVEAIALTAEQRQGLCRFLEEALCNVGKHAHGATRLEVTGTRVQQEYVLRVTDDGVGVRSPRTGEGTRFAQTLAAQLRGSFKREPATPHGTICELRFPLARFGWRSRVSALSSVFKHEG